MVPAAHVRPRPPSPALPHSCPYCQGRGVGLELLPTPHPGALAHAGGPQGWSSPIRMDRSLPCALHKSQTILPRGEDARLSLEHQPVSWFAVLVLGIFQNSHYLTGVMRKLILEKPHWSWWEKS